MVVFCLNICVVFLKQEVLLDWRCLRLPKWSHTGISRLCLVFFGVCKFQRVILNINETYFPRETVKIVKHPRLVHLEGCQLLHPPRRGISTAPEVLSILNNNLCSPSRLLACSSMNAEDILLSSPRGTVKRPHVCSQGHFSGYCFH